MEFNELFAQLELAVIALWSMTEVKFLVGSIFLNVVIAISTSIYTGEFKLYKTTEFLTRKLLPYTMIYAAARVVAGWVDIGWLSGAAFLAIEAGLLSDMLENLALVGLQNGRQIPEGLLRIVSKE